MDKFEKFMEGIFGFIVPAVILLVIITFTIAAARGLVVP